MRVGGIELPTLGLETVCLNCSTSFSGFFIEIYFFNFEGETELGWLLEEAKGRFVPIFFFIFHFFRWAIIILLFSSLGYVVFFFFFLSNACYAWPASSQLPSLHEIKIIPYSSFLIVLFFSTSFWIYRITFHYSAFNHYQSILQKRTWNDISILLYIYIYKLEHYFLCLCSLSNPIILRYQIWYYASYHQCSLE